MQFYDLNKNTTSKEIFKEDYAVLETPKRPVQDLVEKEIEKNKELKKKTTKKEISEKEKQSKKKE